MKSKRRIHQFGRVLTGDVYKRQERSISITATDGEGKTQKGVKMGIFASQPYTGEGIISVEPIFVGYTDASGKLNADVVVANNLSKVFVAPLTAGYGQVQEVDVRNVSSLNFRGVAFPQAATVTRAAADEIPQIFGPISGLYQLFLSLIHIYLLSLSLHLSKLLFIFRNSTYYCFRFLYYFLNLND